MYVGFNKIYKVFNSFYFQRLKIGLSERGWGPANEQLRKSWEIMKTHGQIAWNIQFFIRLFFLLLKFERLVYNFLNTLLSATNSSPIFRFDCISSYLT